MDNGQHIPPTMADDGSSIKKLIALKSSVVRLECALDLIDDISYYPHTVDERDDIYKARFLLAHVLDDTRHRMMEMKDDLNAQIKDKKAKR